jgi:putative ABC transport system permease protein
MIRNYFKIAFRNLTRHRLYTAINISGLAIGLACFILIGLYVQRETSFDRFIPNAENIYRLNTHVDVNGAQNRYPAAHYPAAFDMVDDYPDVVQATTLYRPFYLSNTVPKIRHEQKEHLEPRFYMVDSSFFSVFDFEFQSGNPDKAFANSYSVVLTAETAQRYFGSEDPMGKMMLFQDTVAFTVTGVLKPMPGNTHLTFDFLAHSKLLVSQLVGFRIDNDYRGLWYYSYVVLKPGTSPGDVESRLPDFVKKYYPPRYTDNHARLVLQPIRDIHLYSDFSAADMSVNGNIDYVYTLSTIALLVLIIACINFTNLSVARYSNRGKEVGIRKVMGAEKHNLVSQFLGESLLIAMLSGALAVGIVYIFTPVFNTLANTAVDPFAMFTATNLLAVMMVIVLTGIFAGLYPASVMAAFQPTKVLKGLHKNSQSTFDLRKMLVIAQFTVSLVLLIGTLVIADQLRFMQNKNMGFDQEQVVVVDAAGVGMVPQYSSFKNKLLAIPGIASVTSLSHELGQETLPYFPMIAEGKEEEQMLPIMYAGYDFLETFKLEMAAGRFFDLQHPSDSTLSFVINESAARALGWTDPLNRRITFGVGGNPDSRVIGVIRDFNFDPVRSKVGPLVIVFGSAFSNIAIKLSAHDYRSTIPQIESAWNELIQNQNKPFSFYFLDEAIDRTYAEEQRLADVFSYFCGLAIFIACMGLFALASFSTERRLKEIGVRKVLGATESGLVFMLYKEFLIIILVSGVLAAPLAYYFFDQWLSTFAYHVGMNPAWFLLALLMLTFLAFVTVGYQSWKAARTNPVKILRTE